MTIYPTRNATVAALATLVLFTANAAVVPAADRPDGASLSIAARGVTLADHCDLHATLATVNIHVHNHGGAPSAPIALTIRDSARALVGKAPVPTLNAHEARTIDVPMTLDDGTGPEPASGPSAIAGAHAFVVYAAHPGEVHERITSSVTQISTTIPAAFCAQAIAQTAQPTASPAVGSASQSSAAMLFRPNAPRALLAFASPSPAPTNGPFSATTLRIAVPLTTRTPLFSPDAKKSSMTLFLGVPQNLRSATTITDCINHSIGAIANAATCDHMLAAGNLMLIWDPPTDGSGKGYHVYPLVGSARGPVLATEDNRAQTIAILPPLTSGNMQRCYVVTATDGPVESVAGKAYCTAEPQRTQTFGASYTRPTWQQHVVGSHFFSADQVIGAPAVGYYYAAHKSLTGDSSYEIVHRYAVAFDIDALRGKRVVDARLHLTIQSSYGAGNNHSCATTVAAGNEFWWKQDAQTWIDGIFDNTAAHFNATGPVVTADVTKPVAAIVAGSPNYGFVIRNDYEDLGAFLNAQCETVYTTPQLEVLYYDH